MVYKFREKLLQSTTKHIWDNSHYGNGDYLFLNRTEHIHGDKIFFLKKEINMDGIISLTPKKLLKLLKEKKEKSGK